jgi:hypothetical protein
VTALRMHLEALSAHADPQRSFAEQLRRHGASLRSSIAASTFWSGTFVQRHSSTSLCPPRSRPW